MKLTSKESTVYLIHFIKPYKHARRYLGYSPNLDKRITDRHSDSHARQLARGASALDSVTLIFVIAHFRFLPWIYSHVSTLKAAEAEYKTDATVYDDKVEKAIAANDDQTTHHQAEYHDSVTPMAHNSGAEKVPNFMMLFLTMAPYPCGHRMLDEAGMSNGSCQRQ